MFGIIIVMLGIWTICELKDDLAAFVNVIKSKL